MQDKEKSNETVKQGGFEFTVPAPTPIEQNDEPVSTLFKWGTLDTVKSEESQESEFNNCEVHHYATWQAGQKTPFDNLAKRVPVSFAHREDSAQQSSADLTLDTEVRKPLFHGQGDIVVVCVQNLTLDGLQQSIKRVKPGMILDLGGVHLVADGNLSITVDDITLRNGSLELTQGISVNACGVYMRDLTLISDSSKAATLKVVKRDCCIKRCKLTNTSGVGIQVTGAGSRLAMQQTTVHDCERSCICVSRSGILKIEEECSIQGSRSFHGISATDAGTELWIENSRIFNHFQDGIYVTNSAHACMENCEISGSRAFHGIAGKKFGTTVVLKNCQLLRCRESALIVELGAKARVTDSLISKSIKSPGIVADGHGSHVDILNSEIADCDVGGVLVRGNAAVKIQRTHVFGSTYGNGVVVAESGSHARIINSVIFQNCRNGVLILNQGRAIMESCDISSSTACNGVLVRDVGSQALLDRCQFAKNHSSNVCADAGAMCHVVSCRFNSARNGPSVLARGCRTYVKMTIEDDVVEAMQTDVHIFCRAKITMNEKKCKNRQKWPKLKPSAVFSSKLPFSSDRR